MCLALAWLAGCGSADPALGSSVDGGTVRVPGGDAGMRPPASLAVVGPSRRELSPGAHPTFTVRYTREDGTPIAGATLQYALAGDVRDASLDALAAHTDARGRASGTILAGSMPASFEVRITAPRAEPAVIHVAVSGRGFGRLTVAATPYGGQRDVDELRVRLFRDAGCHDAMIALAGDEGPDRTARIAREVGEADFLGLPAGVRYTAEMQGLGPSGIPLAHGCTDDVTVSRDTSTTATVDLVDEPLQPAGTYDAVATFDTADSAGLLRERVEHATLDAVEQAGSGAAWLLDATEHYLREDQENDPAAQALATLREGGDLVGSLATELAEEGTGPREAGDELADLVAERLATVALSGRLTIEPGSDTPVSWTTQRLEVGAGAPSGTRLGLPLDALGEPIGTALQARLETSTDQIRIEEWQLRLPLGSLARLTLEAVARERDLAAPADLAREAGGCPTLETWMASQPSLADSCDPACRVRACGAAVGELVAAILAAADSLSAQRRDLTVSGHATMHDRSGDLVVDEWNANELTGLWSGPQAEAPDDVASRLSTLRTGDP